MSLLVDLQLVPQRILDRVRAAVLQNREALRHGGTRSRVVQATKQRPQFTKVGATMRDYVAPVPIATGQSFGKINLGWHEKLPFVQTGSTTPPSYKVISGDGSASHTVTYPAYPAVGIPPSAEVTWASGSSWNDWYYHGSLSFASGSFWGRYRSASQLDITLGGWGPNIERNRLVLPHDSGLIFADLYKTDQLFRWYTYSINTTIVYQFVRGGPGDNPAAAAQNPNNVFWQFEASYGPVTVTSGPNDIYHQHDVVNAVSIGKDWVKPITAPEALSEVFNKLHCFYTRTFQPDWTYNPYAGIISYRQLDPVSIDGTSYSNLWIRQVRGDPSLNLVNQWPVVQVPFYSNGVPDPEAGDIQNFLGASTLGLAYLRTASGTNAAQGLMLFPDRAGTPYVYRALLGDIPAGFEPQGGRDLMDVLETMAPTPRQFSIVQAQDGGTSLYTASDTQLQFPTYAATADNFPTGSTFSNLVGGSIPQFPGKPPRYSWSMVPLEQRVAVESPSEVAPLFGITFGEGAQCRQQLLNLGFTEADLTPPAP